MVDKKHDMQAFSIQWGVLGGHAAVAAGAFAAADAHSGARAASAAKVQIGKASKLIGEQAVQLHGGMGMTDELAVGHYFKRLAMIETLFGNTDHHRRRFAKLSDA